MPFITLGTTAQLQIKVPTRGTTGWDETMRTDTFLKIATHDHTGSNGKGVQLGSGALAADSVTGAKILLDNDEYLRGRNAANSADINIIKVDSNDELIIGATVGSVELQDDGLTVVDNADNTKVLAVDVSGVTTATTRTLTVPDASGIIVLNDNTATLTNKTLTSPIISTISNTGTLTLPTATTTLVGTDTTDTLTNKTIDADSNTISNIDNNEIKAAAAIALDKLAATTASKALVSDGSGFISASAVTSTELGYVSGVTSAIQTQLGTKTDTGTTDEITLTGTAIGLADNAILPGTGSVTLPKGTTAQRSGTPASGMFRFNTSNSQFEGYDGTAWGEIGGGSAGINFITNSDFEAGVTDWNTYADAAGENAVDGTGGSATTTFTQNSTTPLRDSADGKLSKDAANRQGEGVSFDFSIDNTDKSSMIKISFDYSTTANYADGDVRVQIYDVTNSNLIRLAPEDLQAGTGRTFLSSFQAAADSTSYRLILHISSTNATAYDVHIDNVEVTPSVKNTYTPVSDWIPYDVTISGTTSDPTKGTTTVDQGWYRRVGDSVELRYDYTQTAAGSNGTGIYLFSLPDGLSLDTDKMNTSTDSEKVNIPCGSVSNGSTDGSAYAIPYTSTQYAVSYSYNTGSDTFAFLGPGGGGISLGQNTIKYNFTKIILPIQGWSTGLNVEESLSGRAVVFEAYVSTGSMSSTSSDTALEFSEMTATTDTHGLFDDTVDSITIPETGYYDIKYKIEVAGLTGGSDYLLPQIKVNGTAIAREVSEGLSALNSTCFLSKVKHLTKGDVVTWTRGGVWTGSKTIQSGESVSYISLHKIQAPSEVLASEKIYAAYSHNAATSLSASTNTTIPYNTKEEDTHNAVSSGVFTAPRSGMYHYSFCTHFASNSWAVDKIVDTVAYKNGNGTTQVQTSRWQSGGLGNNTLQVPTMTGLVYLLKDETLEFTVNHDNGGGNTTGTDSTRSKMTVFSVD